MEKRQAVEFLEYLRQDRNLEGTIYRDALKIAIESLKAQLFKEGTTSDLISRQDAIDAAKDWYEGLICGSVNGLIKRLNALPTIQPESKEGYWIWVAGELMCSECRTIYSDLYPDYDNAVACPHCGAKMRGEQHETD